MDITTQLKNNLKDGLKLMAEDAKIKNYYLNSYNENIFKGGMPIHFQTMFMRGSGNELKDHARAIFSSSMLAYNCFHWIDKKHPFDYDGVKYTEVYFETQLWTLKSSKGSPANMDVVLLGKKGKETHVLFIESKLSEFFKNTDFKLSPSYYKEGNSFCEKESRLEDFAKHVEDVWKEGSRSGYWEGVKQGVTHIFGIFNVLNNDDAYDFFKTQIKYHKSSSIISESKDKLKAHFVNLLFDYQDDDHYIQYKKLYEETIIKSSHNLIDNVRVVRYSELWNSMKNQIDNNDLKDYLWQRYMKYVEGAEQ